MKIFSKNMRNQLHIQKKDDSEENLSKPFGSEQPLEEDQVERKKEDQRDQSEDLQKKSKAFDLISDGKSKTQETGQKILRRR